MSIKLIMENWRSFQKIEEKAIDGFDPSKFPNPLPSNAHAAFQQGGLDDSPTNKRVDAKTDDDIVAAGPGSVPASQLMPSQSAVYLSKAFGMSMIPKLSSGGDIKAVITEDNHILDGHHRWAATILRSGGAADIVGTLVELPITQAIPVLRALGDSFENNRKGNPSDSDINIFSAEALNPDVLKGVIEENSSKNKHYDKERWMAHLQELGGYEKLIERIKIVQALGDKSYNGKGVSGAPERLQMPVLEPKDFDIRKAVNMLRRGAIDVAPPYNQKRLPKRTKIGD